MSDKLHIHQRPMDRTKIELRCLLRALIPMPEESPASWFRKLVTLALLLVWVVLTMELTAAEPDQWLMYALTALLFLIIGRMWDLQLEKLDLPGLSISTSLSDDEED